MLTLQNFEKEINKTILGRGEKYFSSGCVNALDDNGDGIWTAEVEGTETYTVEIVLKNENNVVDYDCDCPYDGDICKHVVAVLFTLRDTKKNTAGHSKKSQSNRSLFDSLLKVGALLTIWELLGYLKK